MDDPILEQKEHKSNRTNGDLTADLYGGIALHGDSKPAIDRDAVLAAWRRTWRVILHNLTPLQRKALDLEFQEGQQ